MTENDWIGSHESKIKEMITEMASVKEEMTEVKSVLNDLVGSCHTVFTNMYGNPKYPGLSGDIKDVKDHLLKINGRLSDGEGRMDGIEITQSDYKHRWRWEKWAIIIGISGGTAGWLDYVDVVDIGSIISKLMGV